MSVPTNVALKQDGKHPDEDQSWKTDRQSTDCLTGGQTDRHSGRQTDRQIRDKDFEKVVHIMFEIRYLNIAWNCNKAYSAGECKLILRLLYVILEISYRILSTVTVTLNGWPIGCTPLQLLPALPAVSIPNAFAICPSLISRLQTSNARVSTSVSAGRFMLVM